MKFNTCACDKDSISMKCVYTGIMFEGSGFLGVRTGDMFFCRAHWALSIHGIPINYFGSKQIDTIAAKYDGGFLQESLNYYASENEGIITLTKKGIDYLHKYDSYIFAYKIGE